MTYQQVIDLFIEWLSFEKSPSLQEINQNDGGNNDDNKLGRNIPNYTKDFMVEKLKINKQFLQRLEDLETSSNNWSIDEKIDIDLVRSQMNGFSFFCEVLKPWSRDPSFYATIINDEPDTPRIE
eukprot:Pgem_evm1s10113